MFDPQFDQSGWKCSTIKTAVLVIVLKKKNILKVLKWKQKILFWKICWNSLHRQISRTCIHYY